jgi:glycosyltransferase involved in cell wall biosynthesis
VTDTASLSFVIPVRNDAVRLGRCLASIRRNWPTGGAFEVIVVDNGSADASPEVARKAGARVIVLPGLTVAELRNRGASEAPTDIVAFVDADHEIAPTWAVAALDAISGDRVGAAGALYRPPPVGTWVQRFYGVLRGTTAGRHDVAWLGSGNLAVRREAFDAIGGFDASLVACEDVDFCQRLRAAGWRVVGDERLESIHLGDPATLAALFRAERWRGRDNLRVSLRGPLSIRDLPSILIPIGDLLLLLAAATAGIASQFVRGGWTVAAESLAAIAVLSALRAVWIAARAGLRRPIDLVRAVLVAIVYDAGRALALLTSASHHRRVAGDRAAARTPA